MSDTGFILFCHGARDNRWREPFDQILSDFRRDMPDKPVELAFLEMMEPRLAQVIDTMAGQGVSRIQVIPLFLAPGGHTRRDLPEILDQARQRWPAITIASAATLTESAPVRQAILSWAREAAEQAAK